MTDINVKKVCEELKHIYNSVPETSRLVRDYLVLREENDELRMRVKEMADAFNGWMRIYPPSELCMRGQYWQLLNDAVAKTREMTGGDK